MATVEVTPSSLGEALRWETPYYSIFARIMNRPYQLDETSIYKVVRVPASYRVFFRQGGIDCSLTTNHLPAHIISKQLSSEPTENSRTSFASTLLYLVYSPTILAVGLVVVLFLGIGLSQRSLSASFPLLDPFLLRGITLSLGIFVTIGILLYIPTFQYRRAIKNLIPPRLTIVHLMEGFILRCSALILGGFLVVELINLITNT